MKYFDRLTIDPIVDGLLNRQFHADPSNIEIRFWSAKIPLLGEYYISKLFLGNASVSNFSFRNLLTFAGNKYW